MNIIISNSGDKPIYEQITSQIKNAIISGELEAAIWLRNCGSALFPRNGLMKNWRKTVLSNPFRGKAALSQERIRN